MSQSQQVFISYQRTDADFARQTREYLQARGVATWMDEYDIPVGAYWPDAIDEALAAADIVLGFLSPDSVASRNVKNEWDWAIANDKRLVLLLVTPTVIPHRYVSINFIDASHDPQAALAALAETLGAHGLGLAANPPQTQYALSGDLNIAYQVFGHGPLDLIVVPGFVSNLDWIWTDPRMTRYYEGLASFARVIAFDKRGTGLSDRAAGVPSVEQRVDDMRAVMDAAGVERAAVMGNSQGGSLAIQFASGHPERTAALVLFGTFALSPWSRLSEDELVRENRETQEIWGRDVRPLIERFAPSMIGDERFADWFARLMRASASPGAVIALREMDREFDLRALLPTITTPTLVMHRTGDRVVPVADSRYLAAHIPGAFLLELPGADHLSWLGDTDSIVNAVRTFLEEIRLERD